jgi:hypothetical protein
MTNPHDHDRDDDRRDVDDGWGDEWSPDEPGDDHDVYDRLWDWERPGYNTYLDDLHDEDFRG